MSEQVSSSQASQPSRPPSRASQDGREPVSGWAVGLATFASVMIGVIGLFQILEGLAAIFKNQFFVVAPNYVYSIDVTVWGWIHLIIGILVFLAAFAIFSGQVWARAVGITFAVLNAISQFLFLPHYPVWSILMIALDVAVIWALCVYRRPAT